MRECWVFEYATRLANSALEMFSSVWIATPNWVQLVMPWRQTSAHIQDNHHHSPLPWLSSSSPLFITIITLKKPCKQTSAPIQYTHRHYHHQPHQLVHQAPLLKVNILITLVHNFEHIQADQPIPTQYIVITFIWRRGWWLLQTVIASNWSCLGNRHLLLLTPAAATLRFSKSTKLNFQYTWLACISFLNTTYVWVAYKPIYITPYYS